MDERYNLSYNQYEVIRMMMQHNECRLAFVGKRESIWVVIKSEHDQTFKVYWIKKNHASKMEVYFYQDEDFNQVFQLMPFLRKDLTYSSLVELNRRVAKKMITEKDVHLFSTVELAEIYISVMKELASRKVIKERIEEKLANKKVLMNEVYERSYTEWQQKVWKEVREMRKSIREYEIKHGISEEDSALNLKPKKITRNSAPVNEGR